MELSGNNVCASIISDADTLIISEQANGSSLTVETMEDIGIDASGDVTFEGDIVTVGAKETAIYAKKVVVNGALLNATVSSGENDGEIVLDAQMKIDSNALYSKIPIDTSGKILSTSKEGYELFRKLGDTEYGRMDFFAVGNEDITLETVWKKKPDGATGNNSGYR